MFRLVIYPKPVLCFVPVVYHGSVVQAGLAVPGRVSKPSILPRLPKEAASFVLQTESCSLCSVSMCSKDKTQENSCCLLTLIIGIIGKWSKQEMTNVFSKQEETVAASCCLVSGVHDGWSSSAGSSGQSLQSP